MADRQQQPQQPKKRSGVLTYGIELTIGLSFGLVLLWLILQALQTWFPDATGLGELIRARDTSPGSSTQLVSDDSADVVVARLSRVERDVQHKPSTSVIWSAANTGYELRDRHAVQSYARSGATITFDEDNEIYLGEKTVIVVRKPRRTASWTKRAAVLFMDGILRGRLGGSGAELGLEVLTAGGAVRSSEGAEIVLAAGEAGAALSVEGGSAEIIWGDKQQKVAVPSGKMVLFSENEAPGKPIALPQAPSPVLPERGEVYRYRTAPPEISFRWRAEDASHQYRVQIARDPDFAEIVYEGDTTKTDFVHASLGPGEYHWSVVALRGPVTSPKSQIRSFVVEPSREPPSLEVDFPTGSVSAGPYTLRGTTGANCKVFIADTPVPTDGQGNFEYTLTLRAGYNFIVVQSIDPYGNTAFKNDTILADVKTSREEP